ncbi:MAG: peptidase S41, partial [Pyrinomonadaceae bacterium]
MSRQTKLCSLTLACVLLFASVPVAAGGRRPVSQSGQPGASQALPYFSEPSVSPDRSEIAFVSGGDIWTVPAAGGEARLLVSHPATEFRPVYSPDGTRLAFTSNRTGNGDLYVLALDGGELRRLTFDDGFDLVDAWSRDGRFV